MPPTPTPLAAALSSLPIGDSEVPGVSRVLALANNENVEAPSVDVVAAITQAAHNANRYPDIAARSLRRRLAKVHCDINADHMLVGVGAGELIALVTQAYCGPGDEVIVGDHGYAYFGIASRAVGARVVTATTPTGSNRAGFSVRGALAAVTPATRVVFVDNPANPLGTYLNATQIRALRAGLPDDVLLVFDCAYAEYATAADFECGDELVRRSDNTMVIRTFSKVYGLAGMRIGWAHAHTDILGNLTRVQRPGNFSSPGLAAAEAALQESALIDARIQRNELTRSAFTEALTNLGLEVTPSQANFILVTLPHGTPPGADRLRAALASEGILVRGMAPYDLPQSLRISLGSADDMSCVAQAIEHILRAPRQRHFPASQ
jgi:histidinol-phosphate aminotransferase